MRPGSRDIPLPFTAARRVRPPQLPWLFAVWMAASALTAVSAGLVLGILAATQDGFGASHWTEAVQAHGRLQLWAFAGVFIVTLSFEFLVRMNGRPMFPVPVRAGVPGGLLAGALLMAAAQVWNGPLGFLGPVGAAALVAAGAVFAWEVCHVRPPHSLKLDPQPWFFWLGSIWLFIAAAATFALSLRWDGGVSLPVESHAVAEIFIRGFIIQVILAVAPRAMVGHLGLRRIDARQQIILLALVNGGLITWLAGQDAGVLPGVSALVRLGNIALGGALLALTWWLGVLDAHRPRRERYDWLLPIAWIAVAVYGIALIAISVTPSLDLNLYQEGAIRHLFLLGFMVPLMIGMAHIVLERFGIGRIPNVNALTGAFIVAMVAWPLRILPALTDSAPGSVGQGLMGLSGALMMVSLALTAFVCARVAYLASRPRTMTVVGLPA
ncbi:MAG TPA: hypothetical protein PKI89_07750 [Tepidiformaceae bacterium]|nr:hypothetical protein [Tepidiformaceae bacterium]